jgi:hypothetical protein
VIDTGGIFAERKKPMNKTDRNLSGEVLAELFPFSKPEATKDLKVSISFYKT